MWNVEIQKSNEGPVAISQLCPRIKFISVTMDSQAYDRLRELQAEAISLIRPLNPLLAARLEREGVSPEQSGELRRMVDRYKSQSMHAAEAQRLFDSQAREYNLEGPSVSGTLHGDKYICYSLQA